MGQPALVDDVDARAVRIQPNRAIGAPIDIHPAFSFLKHRLSNAAA